jgi:hypothetical protein
MRNLLNLLLSIIAASSIASAAHAGIGETYRESNRHYRSTGEWEGDHANWHYRGYLLTEGFDSRGFCNIILIAHTDRSNLGRRTNVFTREEPRFWIGRR